MDRTHNFLITIDTEGDNIWARPKEVTTKNALYLCRFQELCEKYNFKPTYLTNYEMAISPTFQELGKGIIQRKTGEVGMHLHAWNMPPSFQLTKDDLQFHPYLIEYPEKIMREKVKLMTETLEDVFGVKMLSHRAGRWSFNEQYAQLLIEFGYQVDCSVTPHVSWKTHLGDPAQHGGTDYTDFPETAYFLDPLDISRPGDSPLLELPVSIKKHTGLGKTIVSHPTFRNMGVVRKLSNYLFPKIWLRPNGKNLRQMVDYLTYAMLKKKPYVEFMLHSSEFMPGGSPTFPSEPAIENLYADLEVLFSRASENFKGCTLSEYRESYIQGGTNNFAVNG